MTATTLMLSRPTNRRFPRAPRVHALSPRASRPPGRGAGLDRPPRQLAGLRRHARRVARQPSACSHRALRPPISHGCSRGRWRRRRTATPRPIATGQSCGWRAGPRLQLLQRVELVLPQELPVNQHVALVPGAVLRVHRLQRLDHLIDRRVAIGVYLRWPTLLVRFVEERLELSTMKQWTAHFMCACDSSSASVAATSVATL